MKTYGRAYVYIHVLLVLALVRSERSASRPGCFTPEEIALGTHWIGDWVNLRTGLDDVERRENFSISELELRPLRLPVCNQSLYYTDCAILAPLSVG
jgi:hypothetical protein